MHHRFREPTERQLQVVAAMVDHYDEHGEWPTHREIAARADISSNNVRPYLEAIIAKGLAARSKYGARRAVSITDQGRQTLTGARQSLRKTA